MFPNCADNVMDVDLSKLSVALSTICMSRNQSWINEQAKIPISHPFNCMLCICSSSE